MHVISTTYFEGTVRKVSKRHFKRTKALMMKTAGMDDNML